MVTPSEIQGVLKLYEIVVFGDVRPGSGEKLERSVTAQITDIHDLAAK